MENTMKPKIKHRKNIKLEYTDSSGKTWESYTA